MMTPSVSADGTCFMTCLFVIEGLVLTASPASHSIRNSRVMNFVHNTILTPNLKLQDKDNFPLSLGNGSNFNDNGHKESVSSFFLPLYILDESLNGTSAQTSVKRTLLLIKQIPKKEQDNTQFLHKEQVYVSGHPSNQNYNTKDQAYVSSNSRSQNYSTIYGNFSNWDYSIKGQAYIPSDPSNQNYTKNGQAYISGEPYNQDYRTHSALYSTKDFSGKTTILHSYTSSQPKHSTWTSQEALNPTNSSNSSSTKVSEPRNKDKITLRDELTTHISRASERPKVSNTFSQMWRWFPSNASTVVSNNHKPPGSVYHPMPNVLTRIRPSTYYKPASRPLTLINHHKISSYGPHNQLQSLESSTNRVPSLTVLKPFSFANEENIEYSSHSSSQQLEATSESIFSDVEQPSIPLIIQPVYTSTANELVGDLIKGPDLIMSRPVIVNGLEQNDTHIKTSVIHEGLITVAHQGDKNETTYVSSPVLEEEESDRNVSSSEPFSIDELYSQIFTSTESNVASDETNVENYNSFASTEGNIASEETNFGSYNNFLSASVVNPSSITVPSSPGVFVPSSPSSFLTLSSLVKPPSLMSLFRLFLLSIMMMMVPSALTGMSMVASVLVNNG